MTKYLTAHEEQILWVYCIILKSLNQHYFWVNSDFVLYSFHNTELC